VSQIRSHSRAFGVSRLNSGHHTIGRLLPANGTSAITEPDTCLCKCNFSHLRDRSFASCKRYFGYNRARYLPAQVQLRSSQDRSFASCKRSLGYNGANYLPLQVQLRSSRDRLFASCRRYFGYNGASYLPVQVQLRSSRDRSFAYANEAFDPTRAFVVSTLGSMLRCYACIYV
jgi:hypothetical protein